MMLEPGRVTICGPKKGELFSVMPRKAAGSPASAEMLLGGCGAPVVFCCQGSHWLSHCLHSPRLLSNFLAPTLAHHGEYGETIVGEIDRDRLDGRWRGRAGVWLADRHQTFPRQIRNGAASLEFSHFPQSPSSHCSCTARS